MRRWLSGIGACALLTAILGGCMPCRSRGDCPAGEYCDFDTGDCRQGCMSDDDCGGTTFCNVATGSCSLTFTPAPDDAGATGTSTSATFDSGVTDTGTSTVPDAGS